MPDIAGGRVSRAGGPARLIACLASIAALVACDQERAEVTSYAVFDSAGIPIVESAAPTWDAPLVIDPVPGIRVGREEEGPYQLGFVPRGTFLEDGRIAVLEARAQEVRVFDPSGEHVRTLGGPGEGPGEFGGVGSIYSYPGDSVAVFDGRLRRTTVFSVSSGEARVIPNPVEGNYGVFGLLAHGPFLLYSPGGGYRPDLEAGLQWVFTDIVAMDREDGSARVIAHLPDRLRRVAPDGNAPMPEPLQYAIHAVADDGFYWATSDRYEIGFYDGDGRLRRLMRRPVTPPRVEPSVIERFMELRLEAVRRREGEEAVPRYRRMYEEESFGEHLPLFQAAFVDGEGRLWVGSAEWPEPRFSRTWSLFDAAGFWLGDLAAPEDVQIVDATSDLVLGIWRDEFDVPYVQLHRLRSEGSEP